MTHLSLALPVAILALPLVVLFVLRMVAAIADGRTAERSARVRAALDAATRRVAERSAPAGSVPAQPEASATSLSSLTEEPPRDQG